MTEPTTLAEAVAILDAAYDKALDEDCHNRHLENPHPRNPRPITLSTREARILLGSLRRLVW